MSGAIGFSGSQKFGKIHSPTAFFSFFQWLRCTRWKYYRPRSRLGFGFARTKLAVLIPCYSPLYFKVSALLVKILPFKSADFSAAKNGLNTAFSVGSAVRCDPQMWRARQLCFLLLVFRPIKRQRNARFYRLIRFSLKPPKFRPNILSRVFFSPSA